MNQSQFSLSPVTTSRRGIMFSEGDFARMQLPTSAVYTKTSQLSFARHLSLQSSLVAVSLMSSTNVKDKGMLPASKQASVILQVNLGQSCLCSNSIFRSKERLACDVAYEDNPIHVQDEHYAV